MCLVTNTLALLARLGPALALAAVLSAPAAGAGAPGAAPERGALLDEVVAVVKSPGAAERVITLSRLRAEARVTLVSRGGTEAAFRSLDAAALRAALDWVVDQTLVADEAARLQVSEVDRPAVEAELRRFRARFPEAGSYGRFLAGAGLGEEELAAVLARGVQVERYLHSRLGRAPRIQDAELDAWLAARGARDAGPGVREAARAQLAEEKLAAEVKALVAELRGRAEIRVLDALADGGG
jgi:hypothetical protein